ncbi:MAG: inositol monophosphatase family protein [Sphingomonadales bacterium]
MTGLDDDMALAQDLARQAAKVILPHFRSDNEIEINNKAEKHVPFDPVTTADRAAEDIMRSLLIEARPQDGIEGEERLPRPSHSGRRWILDPIDGTRSFIAGVPMWGILIALNDGTRPVLGVAYQPCLDELYTANAQQALLNGAPIHSRACQDLGTARLATTDPALFNTAEARVFEALSQQCQFRRLGLDWYAYALLAAGQIDLVVESGLKPHDVQALIPLVQAAGGRLTNWQGGDAQGGGQVVAAATDALLRQALAVLSPAAPAS